MRNSHSRTIIWFGSFFDCSAPPKKKERLVLALLIQKDGNHRLGLSNQEKNGSLWAFGMQSMIFDEALRHTEHQSNLDEESKLR